MFDTAVKPLNTLLAALLVFCLGPVPYAFAAESEGPTDEIRSEQQHDAEAPETNGILLFVEEGVSTLAAAEEGAPDPLENDLADAGLEETSRSATADGTLMVEAKATDGQSDEEALEKARSIDGVVHAQPNFVYELIDATDEGPAFPAQAESEADLLTAAAPNDPFARIFDPKEPCNQYWAEQSNFLKAWERPHDEHAVTIAVLDTGVMATHADLNANLLMDYAWDSYYGTKLDTSILLNGDNSGHGTKVASAAAAVANNGIGMAGASYNANILPIKVCDSTPKHAIDSRSIIAGFDYIFGLVDKGILTDLRVINMSMGSYSNSMRDSGLEERIERARNQYGIVTVCAGGNGDRTANPKTARLYPSDFEACVSVTALQTDGTNIPWSDYNIYKDISAPGQAITSALATDGADNRRFSNASGTSLAAPIVSGAMAYLFSARPDTTVDEAIEALYAAADPIVDHENDRSGISGSHGALDVAGALEYLDAHPFSDVAESDWHYKPVLFANQNGIMGGYPGTSLFKPEKTLTRAEAAQVLYNYLGKNAVAPAAPLSDVDQSQWYAKPVNWAVETGLMTGIGNTGAFGIDQTLTREQLAAIVSRIAGADVSRADRAAFEALPDHGETSPWAVPYMVWATDAGVINGVVTPQGAFLQPIASVTRAQMAQFMMNAIENKLF